MMTVVRIRIAVAQMVIMILGTIGRCGNWTFEIAS